MGGNQIPLYIVWIWLIIGISGIMYATFFYQVISEWMLHTLKSENVQAAASQSRLVALYLRMGIWVAQSTMGRWFSAVSSVLIIAMTTINLASRR